MAIFLITGLGNPGAKYQHTRHNAGFMVIDLLAYRAGISLNTVSKAPSRQEAEVRWHGNRVILLKPLTYMNRSGEAISRMVNFFKIPLDNLLVIHDDLDMQLGRIKLVRSGGAGGHNGIRSIITCIGSKEFPRLKIGIGRPDNGMPVDRYVLSRFGPDEKALIEKIVSTSADAAEQVVEHSLQHAMNEFNGISIT